MKLLSALCAGFLMSMPIAPVDGYVELGCIMDSKDARVMPVGPTGNKRQKMSAEICSGVCEDYEYFGTQFAWQCFCANDVPSPPYEHDGCDMACKKTSGEICGGRNALTVYQQSDSGSPTPPPVTPPPSGQDACNPNPCDNAGQCDLDPGGGHICTCASGFGGMSCQFDTTGLTPFSITLSYTVAGNTDTEWTEQDKADHRRFADRWENVITHVPCGPGDIPIELEWARKFKAMAPTTDENCPNISSGGHVVNSRKTETNKKNEPNGEVWESFVTHEMGHAIGIGYLWAKCTDCIPNGTSPLDSKWDEQACPSTYATWLDLAGVPAGTEADIVETDTTGLTGECTHWDFDAVPAELNNKGTFHRLNANGEVFLSKLTLAALEDIGYIVDPSKADPFQLP